MRGCVREAGGRRREGQKKKSEAACGRQEVGQKRR